MENPLLSCRVKIERAKKHRHDLKEATETLNKNEFTKLVTEDYPDLRIFKLFQAQPIPPEFSCYIGDCIHNLRSALDALAVALVQMAMAPNPIPQSVMQDTYFPIHWDGKFSARKTVDFFSRVGPDVEKIIRKLEPYRGGDGDRLWGLDALDIIDKHRSIIPVLTHLADVRVTGSLSDWRNGKFTVTKRFDLKEGDELARWEFKAPANKPTPHFLFQIAFGKGPFEGKAVPLILDELGDFVERTIDIFARNVFKLARF